MSRDMRCGGDEFQLELQPGGKGLISLVSSAVGMCLVTSGVESLKKAQF